MTDTASPLAPLPVAAGLLPSAPRSAARSARRPGVVGARSRVVSFGVGLGLGARRRHLGVPSTAAGQPIRPPQEWTPGSPIEELEISEAWSPWQVSDQMAAPAIRGLVSTQRAVVAEPRQHRPPTTAATLHRQDRSRSTDTATRSTSTSTTRPMSTGPAVPAITENNQIEFAETGHDAGSRGDMLSKLAQLNRLRDGAPPRPNTASPVAQPPQRTPASAPGRSLVEPLQPAASHRDAPAPNRPLVEQFRSAAPPSLARTPGTASAIEFVSAWESSPIAGWPDLESAPSSPAESRVIAGAGTMLPAAAAALEALRESHPADARTTTQAQPPAPVPPAPNSRPSTPATASAAAPLASPSAWPGDMAPGEQGIHATDSVRQTSALAAPRSLPAPTERVRAQLNTDGQIQFGDTGHDEGSQSDMLSKLAQLENLRDPGRPAPFRSPVTAPQPALDDPPTAVESANFTPAWPTDVSTPGLPTSATNALARAIRPPAAMQSPATPAERSPTPASTSSGSPGQQTRPNPAVVSSSPAEAVATSPPAPLASAVPSPPSSVLPVAPALSGSPTPSSAPGSLVRRDLAPEATLSAPIGPLASSAPAAPLGADRAGLGDSQPNPSPTSAAALTIDAAVAPPLAVRFLHELRSRQRVETEALPMAFRPLADQIAGTSPVTIATGAVSRRALGAVGRRAATIGSTIHLAERLDGSVQSQELLAHELTHVAESSPMPRFFDDPIVTAEERAARRAEQVVRRAIRDGASPTSASRGRSVGGAVPAVRDPAPAADLGGAASLGGIADVIRRSPAGSSGSSTMSAQSLVDQAQGRSSGASSPSSSTVRRTAADHISPTAPVVRRAAIDESGTTAETPIADTLPSMDEIVREVERRLTKKIIGERVRRGQSLRGRI